MWWKKTVRFWKNGLLSKVVCMIVIMLAVIGTGILSANSVFHLTEKGDSSNQKTEGEAGEKSEEKDQETSGKDYDLPIPEKEMQELHNSLIDTMKLIWNIYQKADKGTTVNVVLPERTIYEMQNTVSALGDAVSTTILYSYMKNYKSMDNFLRACMEGEEGSIILYEIHLDGGIGRYKFTFDGTDMYVISASASWNEENEPVISSAVHAKIEEWEYTEKGWFCYNMCVPAPPEVSEVVDGGCMIRVQPMKEEYRTISEKCVKEIGYQGNNLLRIDWNVDSLEMLDYNGLYDSLYLMKYGEYFDGDKYPEGIPRENFENLIMDYLPVTREQIREYAVFNEKTQTYAWNWLGCFNNSPTFFATSFAEVTDIKEKADDSVVLTVDAVCDMVVCNDKVITHELTVRFAEDGSFQYLGNKIIYGRENIPPYQYRVSEY